MEFESGADKLSGRYKRKRKAKKKHASTPAPPAPDVYPDAEVAEHEPEQTDTAAIANREANVKPSSAGWFKKPDPFDLAVWGFVVGLVIAAIYYFQLRSMQESVEMSREAMQIDQRAWLYPEIPETFAFSGQTIPATIRLYDIGKTLATDVTGYVIATTFNKGESPAFDEFGVGHPHTKVYGGAIYPTPTGKPLDVPLIIVRYSDKAGEQPTPVIPDSDFIKAFNDKQLFIIMFGRIDYCDVFGVKHWVKFCNGSGGAQSSDGIKQCINYNRADNSNSPDKACGYPSPAN